MVVSAGTVIDGYLIQDAAKYARLSKTMVDYLCRQKVLVPSAKGHRGRGRPRKYSFGDVVMLRAVGQLLASGVSVQRIKKALNALRRVHPEITPDRLPAKYLVTDGVNVFLKDGRDHLMDLDGTRQMSFFFVLELQVVRDQVLKAIASN